MSEQSGVVAQSPPASISNISASALQQVIDQAAHFNMFSLPDQSLSNPAIFAPGNSKLIGMRVQELLHRFQITVQPPTAQRPLTARNTVGEVAGRFTHRWLLAPDDWAAVPDRDPPPTPLDSSRSQRFVMLNSVCRFGRGEDGFRGFGTGQTLPTTIDGKSQLLITAVGTIVQGFGRFEGHEQGTYVYCGALTAQHGFIGNVLLRVMDPQESLSTDNDLRSLEAVSNPEPGITYVVFRGQAVPGDPVSPKLGPNGQPTGLIVVQGLRLLDLDFQAIGHGGVKSLARVGQSIGNITANVTFDAGAPGGTNFDPIPFLASDEFVFVGDDPRRDVGSLTANSTEGRVFKTLLTGLPGIRFGGTGHILTGAGPFAGISGLMTDNSVVAFTPHVSASVYVLRIHDPQGRFRATKQWKQVGKQFHDIC